jgi:hypothetical protein
MGVEFRIARRARASRAEAFDVGRINRIAPRIEEDRTGKRAGCDFVADIVADAAEAFT